MSRRILWLSEVEDQPEPRCGCGMPGNIGKVVCYECNMDSEPNHIDKCDCYKKNKKLLKYRARRKK